MRIEAKNLVLKTWPFSVEELDLSFEGKGFGHKFHRLVCPDWANILPVTQDGQAILIRQPRAGSLNCVLETPGGVINESERDATLAAQRELEEETGYTTQRILSLGAINPNPAIMSNRCHFFLGMGCYVNPQRRHFPDPEERLTVELHPVGDLDQLVRTGQINHGLSALCIMLAAKYLNV